jgi:hypothetical protein
VAHEREGRAVNAIESKRDFWAKIAKENGWYVEPFHVQVWVNGEGEIVDSVSFQGLDRDIIETA